MSISKLNARILGTLAVILSAGIMAGGVFGQSAIGADPASAQDYDMTWSGRVDARVRIRIRGRSATVRTVSGQRTTGISYDFRNRLPTNRNVTVSVRKRDGRGDVRIVQQPTNRNNHTAVVEVYDSRGGSDFYRFDLFWGGPSDDDFDNRPENPDFSRDADLTWQGRVDSRIQIRVRNRIATIRTLSGRYPSNVRYDFRRALPTSTNFVSVRKRDGRGTVRIIEQPQRSNGYSALVEIDDPRGGDDFYSFELNWERRFDNQEGNIGAGSMSWRGSVDATTRISIRGRSARTIVLNGQPTLGISFNFASTLPRRSVYVRVEKRDGRGSVRVIQQPTNRNGYTAIVEIRDSRSGRDSYAFDLYW